MMEYEKWLPSKLEGNVLDIGHYNGGDLFAVYRHYHDKKSLSDYSKFIGIDSMTEAGCKHLFRPSFDLWCRAIGYGDPFLNGSQNKDAISWPSRFEFKEGLEGSAKHYSGIPHSCDIILAINSLHFEDKQDMRNGLSEVSTFSIGLKMAKNMLSEIGVLYVSMYLNHSIDGWPYSHSSTRYRPISLEEVDKEMKISFGEEGVINYRANQKYCEIIVDRRLNKPSPTS